MTKSHSNGAYGHTYSFERAMGLLQQFTLTPEGVNRVKLEIFGTTNQHAGHNGVVYCDNSGAVNVL